MKINVTYIVSNINKSLAFEWVVQNLSKEKFNLSFVLLNPAETYLQKFLEKNNIPTLFITYKGKRDAVSALLKTKRFLKLQKTKIVHCHLFDAALIGLSAAKLGGVKKRIYTRHHSTYHHLYHPGSVKWDKLCNRLSTDIISISNVVSETLKEKENVPASKISVIHHGFDLQKFSHPDPSITAPLRKKYNPFNKHPVIGVISRFTEWKGVQYIVPAFKNILNNYPNALLLLFNAEGNYAAEINKMLGELPENSVKKIVFENDITSVYPLFDLFVHTPIDSHSEAFGQVYIEALAAGIPGIFTLSGIANEFIENKVNALVVPSKNSEAIQEAIIKLLSDEKLVQYITAQGAKDVAEKFNLEKMVLSLECLYAD